MTENAMQAPEAAAPKNGAGCESTRPRLWSEAELAVEVWRLARGVDPLLNWAEDYEFFIRWGDKGERISRRVWRPVAEENFHRNTQAI